MTMRRAPWLPLLLQMHRLLDGLVDKRGGFGRDLTLQRAIEGCAARATLLCADRTLARGYRVWRKAAASRATATALLAVILLDSVNLDPAARKVTPRDVAAAARLSSRRARAAGPSWRRRRAGGPVSP